MKKIVYKYRNLIKATVVVPVFAFLISYGCQNNETEEQPIQLNYSGEEIFRGIFFSEGDLPNQIDALKSDHEKSEVSMATNKNLKEFKLDFSNEIVKSIKVLDPMFFSQFKKQMESKNYYGIQLAMANATKMIKAGGYNSKYSGYFKLSDKLESKKADLTSIEFKNIDVNTPEGITKYKSLIKEKYEINVDDEDYKIACTPGVVVCYALAAVVSIAAVVYSGVVVAAYAVYSKVEFWGGAQNQNAIGNVLIEELARKLGSSHGYTMKLVSTN